MSRVNSREKYIEELFSLFKKTGLNLTMDEIAKGINLTKKTLYNNFSGKDELMRLVMQHVIGDIEFQINLGLQKKVFLLKI